MATNDDPLKDLVRQYRSAIDPTPEHVERERARLLARLAAETPAEPPRRAARPALLVAAVAAALLLVAGALGLYIDLRVRQAVDASLAVKQAQGPAPLPLTPREVGPPRAVEVAPPIGVVPPPAPQLPPDPPLDPPAPELAPEPTGAATASAPRRRPAELDADALIRESVLLSAAREAQARGDWGRVLELVDDHRRSHPHGALLEERLVLEAAAACNSDQRARGQKAVQALRRRFPRSLALARVSDMCEGTGDE